MKKRSWLALGLLWGMLIVMGISCDKKGAPIGIVSVFHQPCEVSCSQDTRKGTVGLGMNDWISFEINNPNDHKVNIKQVDLEWLAGDIQHTGWITGRTVILKDESNVFGYAYVQQGPVRFQSAIPYWLEPRAKKTFKVYMDANGASQDDWAQFFVVALNLKDEDGKTVGIKQTPLRGEKVYVNILFPVSCVCSAASPEGVMPAQVTEVLRFHICNNGPDTISVQSIFFEMVTTDNNNTSWPTQMRQWWLYHVSSPTPITSVVDAGPDIMLSFFDLIAPNSSQEYVIKGDLNKMPPPGTGDTLKVVIRHIAAVNGPFVQTVSGDPNSSMGLLEGGLLEF